MELQLPTQPLEDRLTNCRFTKGETLFRRELEPRSRQYLMAMAATEHVLPEHVVIPVEEGRTHLGGIEYAVSMSGRQPWAVAVLGSVIGHLRRFSAYDMTVILGSGRIKIAGERHRAHSDHAIAVFTGAMNGQHTLRVFPMTLTEFGRGRQ